MVKLDTDQQYIYNSSPLELWAMLNKSTIKISFAILIGIVSSFLFIPAANAAACSPTSTTYGSYTVLSFTTTGTCTWTAPNDIYVADILLIGGGGGADDEGWA